MKLKKVSEKISVYGYVNYRGFIKEKFFELNPFHRSLETELLEPRKMRIWSFRVDRKYRAIFIFRESDIVEIIDINNHYQ